MQTRYRARIFDFISAPRVTPIPNSPSQDGNNHTKSFQIDVFNVEFFHSIHMLAQIVAS